MPNVSLVEFSTRPCWDTDVASVYSGWPPISYGHQIRGWTMVSAGNRLGANVTLRVVLAGIVTRCRTVILVRPPGTV